MGLFSKLFGGGKQPAMNEPQVDAAPASVETKAPEPTLPRVVSAEWTETDQIIFTMEVEGTPRFIRRQMHGTRPRSKLLAAADTLEGLDAITDPMGEVERLEADDPIQILMAEARATEVDKRAD